MELISNAIVPWAIHQEVSLVLYIASIAERDTFFLLLYFRIFQFVFASYELPDAVLSYVFYVLGF